MLEIIKADERLSRPTHTNIVLLGASGVGKTTQARTLPADKTLFVDYEAGTMAIEDWPADVMDVRNSANALQLNPWELSRAIACLLAGPDPSDASGPYSRKAFDYYSDTIKKPESFNVYEYIFVDSITVAARNALEWCKTQPQAFSEKTGKPDTRGLYGLLGQELVRWFTTLQHVPKSVIMSGILDRFVDDLSRVTFEPQIDGSKASRELPGIFDEVITLANIPDGNGGECRAFVCHQNNPYKFPAKDRSGRLECVEPPNLYALIQKMRTGKRLDSMLHLK